MKKRIDSSYLDKAIARIDRLVFNEQLACQYTAKDIRKAAKKTGFILGRHKLVLIRKAGFKAGFKIKRIDTSIITKKEKKSSSSIDSSNNKKDKTTTKLTRRMVSIRLSEKMIAKLAEFAVKAGRTKTDVVEKALTMYMKNG